MTFAPQNPIEGVVYPDPSDMQRWAEAGAITRETLADGFRQAASRHAERDAVRWLEGKYSYRELDAITDSVAASLLKLGLKPCDRVLFQLTNTPETLVSFLACWKAGIIPICTLAAHREAEIGYLGDFGGAKAHFIETDAAKFDFAAFAKKMQGEIPGIRHIISTRGPGGAGIVDLVDLMEENAAEARATLEQVAQDPFQVAAFQLSGGTTGVPKIIPRIHSEYLYNMRQVAAFKGWNFEDRIFVPMPFAHNLNMGCGWGPIMMSGGAVIATPRVDQDAMRETHNALRPTVMGAAKPIVMRMKAEIAEGRIPTEDLREIFSTDAAEIVDRDMGVTGHHIFGMTEGTIMFTREGDSEFVRFDTCGTPISEHDEVRLLEPGTEDEVPDGEVGELAVFGPYTIRGYYNAPERNAETFTSDGFYRSGDLMKAHVVDGVRYFSFEGRIKDVVDRAGEKVNCEEVERAVMAHPAFTDVAVVGMPSPTHGERICLYGVADKGTDLPDVKELGAFLKKSGLAVFKWPERIEPIDALPLTKVGKLDKVALRKRIAETLASEDAAQAS
ncbi:AMP-binding protein [Sulfitobacter pseudonitzschiae]|uniref:AMP-binding protein n=1 Tax=Pseudosulfitobacter pseudonitzschiae TaxID=1402135 RepID=A0A9Q2P507_9RHOB|nr:AMP-binding protein [Pseudosulfitobacter pseudonitzschiae]MBM2294488.1 AMP-binding protein [Pseudosulfitobacter pseudonitzschiae]MBM2299456.1 AMP-binding protein [Pseudosulfitobacter pseudonitzschiae]MBM2304320.1 AMP-binding protein [Pseudosulfitobacter pseudonitzschiae]MBM2314100.1 AMP-binding protein [Pseudosulfitobacter pseudonitzschiae]MBM2319015.1 AMP-binding protein [Pseudosulfitobacter pseudonitzschiae]